MTRKSIVRAAWVIAAGFILFASAPGYAAPSGGSETAAATTKPLKLTKSSKPRAKVASRSRKPKIAVHRSAKTKNAAKPAGPKVEQNTTSDAGMPDAVANAKAEMPQTDTRGAGVIDAPASHAASMEIAAATQMNELDRAVSAAPDDSPPRSIRTELVTDDRPQASMPVVASGKSERASQAAASDRTRATNATAAPGDAWAQSSLIGKIFIAFGGMLTLASAARMLIA